jgi:hypothetical protein
MGRGTIRRMVEGLTDSECPSTAFQAVPLPIAFGDREESVTSKDWHRPFSVPICPP